MTGDLLYKLKQRVDICALKHLAGLTRWSDRDRECLLASLEKEVGGNDEITACVYENKRADGGRPDLSDTFASWPNSVFRLVSGRFYQCVDAESMSVRLLAQILRRGNIGIDPMIDLYLQDRKSLFNSVRAETGASNKSDRDLKHAFLAVLNLKTVEDEWFDCPTMRTWSAIWNRNVDLLRKKIQCTNYYDNPSFLAWVWNVEERKCMAAAIDFLRDNNYKVGVYKFDEVGIEGEFTDKLIEDVQGYIKIKTGFEVVFKRKGVLPTQADYDIFYSQRTVCSFDRIKKGEIDYATWQLVLSGYTRKAIRYEGYVLSAHPTVPGVYLWQEDAKAYINNALRDVSYTQAFPVDMDKLLKWFHENHHSGFPLKSEVDMRTEWISFRDCTFNTVDCKLYRYNELPSPAPFTDHFYDVDMYGTDLADESLTPNWTKLVNTQLQKKVGDFFEAMIGRLQFPVGKHDGWQIMPFMLGTASTGKGTVLSAIKRMKPDGRVGSISQNFESVFGLDALKHKSIVICWDMPLDMPRRLNQATLQSMVSGEGVSIPAKYKKAETTMDWKIPMIWASNSLPNYKDTQGQISRRLCVFRFNTPVEHKDHSLVTKVMNEVPIVLLRCIAKYRALVERAADFDFWKQVAPEDCRAEKENLAQQADYLRLFLSEGSMKYMVIYKKGSTVSYRHLQAVVLEFLRDEQKQHRLRFDDLGTCALEERFVVRKKYKDAIYVCTYCNTHGSDTKHCNSKCVDERCFNVHKKELCKGHYRADLRRKITCVENMQLVPRDRYEQQEAQKDVEERATKRLKTADAI